MLEGSSILCDELLIILFLSVSGGPGIVRNVGRATELFERAVDQGDIMAMNFLGNIVQNGIAGSKDANRAYELFSMSGRRGNVLAQVNAGLCLQNGIGCKKDLEEAARFFQMAHEAGSPHGSALLGSFYARGEGGYEKDVVKARELFEKVAVYFLFSLERRTKKERVVKKITLSIALCVYIVSLSFEFLSTYDLSCSRLVFVASLIFFSIIYSCFFLVCPFLFLWIFFTFAIGCRCWNSRRVCKPCIPL